MDIHWLVSYYLSHHDNKTPTLHHFLVIISHRVSLQVCNFVFYIKSRCMLQYSCQVSSSMDNPQDQAYHTDSTVATSISHKQHGNCKHITQTTLYYSKYSKCQWKLLSHRSENRLLLSLSISLLLTLLLSSQLHKHSCWFSFRSTYKPRISWQCCWMQ